MELTLDRVILRAADPAATLAELAERTGAPVLAPAQPAGAFTSGSLRASVDIEVLAIGAEPPPELLGYGLGFTADIRLQQASTALRRAGLKTSPEISTTVGERTWATVQVHGLLPHPFPAPTFRVSHTTKQRMTEWITVRLIRLPPFKKPLTTRAGSSMVALTEYRFDAARWRAAAGPGPTVVTVEVGTAGHDWSSVPIAPGPLVLDPDGPPGVRRIVFEDGLELRFG